MLLSNYAFSKPYSSNNPHEACVLVEAAEAVATNFVRFGDERKRWRIRLCDDVFDFVDLALWGDAGEDFVFLAGVETYAVWNRDATMQTFDKLFRNLVGVVGYDVEHDWRLQTCGDLVGDLRAHQLKLNMADVVKWLTR